jgi:hypothetical protein
LNVLKQTGSVEDYANKFQFLVAEIVAMHPSEGDLLQKFRTGLKPDMQMAAGIDPVTGTRWMNLQKFNSFACATDASRAQATKALVEVVGWETIRLVLVKQRYGFPLNNPFSRIYHALV